MIVTAISFPRVCTTVNAAVDDFQYICAVRQISTGEIYLFASREPVRVLGYYINSRFSRFYIGLLDKQITDYDIANISYNEDLGQWISTLDELSSYSNSSAVYQIYPQKSSLKTKMTCITYVEGNTSNYLNDFYLYSNYDITADEKSVLGGFSTNFDDLNLPTGITEETILDIVNESINSTTQTTTQAQSAQASLASDYQDYSEGNISSQALQVSIDNTVDTLNALNDNAGNTLADLMAVNNGLTYAQTVQDKINADEIIATQTVTSTVQLNINGYINQANNAYNDFTSGNKTQSEAIEIIQQQIINLNNIITSGQAQTAADVAAVNAAINTVQNTSNSVHNYSELDKSVSEKSQQSDQEELEYLDSLETTSSIQDMSPSQQMQTQEQSGNVQPLLSVIWDNELIKIILPLTAGFLVISVALGRKFKL